MSTPFSGTIVLNGVSVPFTGTIEDQPKPPVLSMDYDGTIAVSGNHLVNGHGSTVQLRGMNIQQHVYGMLSGAATLSPSGVPDCAGGQGPNDRPATDNGLAGAAARVTAIGPDPALMAPWKFNCVRVGINEASWLSYTVYDTSGVAHNPNNYGAFTHLGYQDQITEQIRELNGISCYVILTLAFTHPGLLITDSQEAMADQDHSIQCWTSLANLYGYPNGTQLKRNGGPIDDRSVIFETFNEPWVFGAPVSNWTTLMQGGFVNVYYQRNSPFVKCTGLPVTGGSGSFTPGEAWTASNGTAGTFLCDYTNTTTGLASSGTRYLHIFNATGTNTSGGFFSTAIPIPIGTTITGSTSGATAVIANVNSGQYGWYIAGHQQMVNAIRATGAWNPVLCSGLDFAKDLSSWAANAPTDSVAPAGYSGPGWTPQLGCAWHPYPVYSSITSVTGIAAGGSGYAVNDTILLAMDESGGPFSGNCYWQAQLKVTGVTGSAVNAVSINSYVGGTPGVSGGNTSQFNVGTGGVWASDHLPSNPIPQYSSSGGGTGATFNVAFTVEGNNESAQANWNSIALPIKNSSPQVPVVITETGEHTGTGIVGSPMMGQLTQWCDTNGVSLVAYAYTPNAGWYDVHGYDFSAALSTSTGSPTYRTPSPGYGVFMYNWFTTHSVSTAGTPTIIGGRVVISSKKLSEMVIEQIDFISQLGVGETISTATCTCSVYTGVDPSPLSMISGAATVSGTVVSQLVIGGVLGVIYEFLTTVTTSLGQKIELAGYLAVIPDLI
jgi:hypothetical protein